MPGPPGSCGYSAAAMTPTPEARGRRWPAWVLALLTATVATGVVLQLDAVNGPEEWQWAYREPGLAAVPALVALAAMAAAVGVAASVRRLAAPLLGGLAVVASVAVVAAQPGGLERVVGSVVSRHSFSYLYDAAVAPPTGELLRDYPRHARRLSLHSRTHPPGPLLLVRAVDALAAAVAGDDPAGEPSGLAAAGRRALEEEAERARARRRPSPERMPHPWTPAALAFLLLACSGLTAWPLHALARRWDPAPEAAGLAAVLWLLVPARTLFTPSLDQALTLPLALALLLAHRGGEGGRGGIAVAALAGLLAAACCLTTFGYLAAVPLVAFAGLAAVPAAAWRSRLPALAALGAGFATPFAVLAGYGLDVAATFRGGLATHRAMAVVSRDYATWLLWNPWDFALLLGPAVALLALTAAAVARGAALRRTTLAWWSLLAVLWLAGSVRGEVGRIWLMFMPLACLSAAGAAPWLPPRPLRSLPGLAVLAAQAALLFALAANLVFVS